MNVGDFLLLTGKSQEQRVHFPQSQSPKVRNIVSCSRNNDDWCCTEDDVDDNEFFHNYDITKDDVYVERLSRNCCDFWLKHEYKILTIKRTI